MWLADIETTKDVKLPKDPIDRVVGQDAAVEKVRLAIKQKRHLLLVGPPGVGKSMLAQALASHLPKPKQQISIVNNPQNDSRPFVQVQSREEVAAERKKLSESTGVVVDAKNIPAYVAERLGFRCARCGFLDEDAGDICPSCGANKSATLSSPKRDSPFGGIIKEVFDVHDGRIETEVHATRKTRSGDVEAIVYQKSADGRVRILDGGAVRQMHAKAQAKDRNTLVALDRKVFVHATGASETELLGDVRHDPYGGHPEIGTPSYKRVVAGAVHEAHEGVLFVDELPHLGGIQSYILTAMQERKFPITGRNPQSAGASVRVDDVPCDFLFVGACNIGEVKSILPPLRSRIMGGGYEILLETTMKDTPSNRMALARFIAQEIDVDGRIPHATRGAVEDIVKEASKRAKTIDDKKNSLTIRLRGLGGVVRMAGDFAMLEGSEYIESKHVEKGIAESKSIEHQLEERYGSVWGGMEKDAAASHTRREDRSYL